MTHSLSALLGSDLKAARTRAGLSQAAVAARADVAIGTIRGLETGIGTIPSFEVTRRALDLQFEGAPSETRLGDVLRGTRTKLGISVKRLCLAAKISKPTAIALERSRGNLSSANAAAAVLGNAPRLIPKLQPKISAILSSENLVVDDCVTFMRKLKKRKEMFDALITDPPYHLRLQAYGPNKGYMRTEWDGGNIAFSSSTWRAAHAVLRPGAFLVAFGAPRTFHRLVSAVEGAGFEIRDMMVWVCSTGLPKSLDVARSIEGLMAGNARYSGRRLPAKDGPAQPGPHMQRMAGTEWSGRTVELRHPEALKRAGLGTALKPGHEPILIARKPISEANV